MSWVFIRKSKRLHPELWHDAGKPTLMVNGDLFSAWPLNKYLMNRDFQRIKQQNAKDFAEKMRLPFILSYFLALISVIVFLCIFFIIGTPD